MEQEEKEYYVTPTIEVVEVKTEGVVCGSPNPFSPFHNDGNGNEDYIW